MPSAMITDEDKLACALRELALRKRVYPRLIENGKLKPAVADRELELMAAIVDDYRAFAETGRVRTRGV